MEGSLVGALLASLARELHTILDQVHWLEEDEMSQH